MGAEAISPDHLTLGDGCFQFAFSSPQFIVSRASRSTREMQHPEVKEVCSLSIPAPHAMHCNTITIIHQQDVSSNASFLRSVLFFFPDMSSFTVSWLMWAIQYISLPVDGEHSVLCLFDHLFIVFYRATRHSLEFEFEFAASFCLLEHLPSVLFSYSNRENCV